jgi:DNA-binding transcriptional regulator YhcF (GntR family)
MNKPVDLHVQLDFGSGIPAYLQIFSHVQRLAGGTRLRPGDQLPTVRSLARQVGLNFNTVARAYRALDTAGVVSTQRGRGTYILERAAAFTAGSTRRATLHALTRKYLADARRLQFSTDEIRAALERGLSSREKAG